MKSYWDAYWKVLQGFDDKDGLNCLSGKQNDDTLPNLNKKKTPRDKKEARGKDESPGKQAAQTKACHKEKKTPVRTEPSTSRMMHMNNPKTWPKKEWAGKT